MKVYVRFYTNSTGYIEGSIPPQFTPENVKPIPVVGTDGVFILDGRNTLRNMIYNAESRMNKMNRNLNKGFVGFKIVRSERFTDNGVTLYSSLKSK